MRIRIRPPVYVCGIAVAVVLVTTGCEGVEIRTAAPRDGAPAQQWTMPNLVGANLQTAQDRIQTLTGGAIFFTSSHDASGRRRAQVFDRQWKVCSQNVAAGKPITRRTKINFGAVKRAEKCP